MIIQQKWNKMDFGNNVNTELESLAFGLFDPLTMSISIERIDDMAKQFEEELDRIDRQFIPSQIQHSYSIRTGISVRSPALRSQIENSLLEHRKRFAFYYRLRVHEKSHWYLTTSSSLYIGRLLANDDVSYSLSTAIKKIGQANGPIRLPLIRWAQCEEFPPELSKPLELFQLNRLMDAAVDGDVLPGHFSERQHLLSFFFPDLRSKREFWLTPSYSVGARSLCEGAGKAAEWLYDLKDGRASEEQAWEDIYHCPKVYHEALDQLMVAVPGMSLLKYLQTLSVLVEFAMNPPFSENTWPFLWGEYKSTDVLPGFRYQRLLQLLIGQKHLDFASKECVAEFMTDAASNSYGWKPPKLIAKHLRQLLAGANFVVTESDKVPDCWNPLESIRRSLDLKSVNALVYVAPVEADLIGGSKTGAPLILSSPGLYSEQQSGAFSTYIVRWLFMAELNNIVYGKRLECPIARRPWVAHWGCATGICKLDPVECAQKLSAAKKKDQLAKCKSYSRRMAASIENWTSKIDYMD